MGQLWRLVAPQRRVLAVGIGLGVLATALELLTPLATKWVLDGLSGGSGVGAPVLLLGGVMVVGAVVGLAQGILLGTLAERVVLATRTGMVRSVLRARLSAAESVPPGELVTRITSDTLLVREATTTTIVHGLNGLLAVVGAVALMAVLDLPLLLVTLVMVGVVAGVASLLMPQLAVAERAAQAEVGRMGGRLEGVLRAVRTVKSSRAEEREVQRVADYASRSADHAVRAVRLENVSWALTSAGVNVAVLVVLGLGAWRVSTGALDVNTLIAFLLYVVQLMWPLMMLSMAATSLQSGLAAAARIDEVTSLTPEEDAERETPRVAPPTPGGSDLPPAIELRGVTFRYRPGLRPALCDVDLSIPRRGHTAIVGPSGAGKTTVFSLLLRFLEPERGLLVLDGRPFEEFPLGQLRRRLAYVEQDTPLVPGTVRDNVTYAATGMADDRVWQVLEDVRMAERIRRLPDGLDTEIGATVVSGGERQRLAVARALLADPDILLLDEVTAQLDALTEAAVAEGIRRQAARGAVVTIAHRLSTVMDADRIVVLDEGRVRATGVHRSLLAEDALYRDLVAALRIRDEPSDGSGDEAPAGDGYVAARRTG